MLTTVLACFAGYEGYQAWDATLQSRALGEQAERLKAELAQLQAEAASHAQVRPSPYAADMAALTKLAGFPPEQVLASVENARVAGVRVSTIDINAADGFVKLEIEALDQGLVLKYLEALNAGDDHGRWQFAQSHVVGAPAGGVVAWWRGGVVAWWRGGVVAWWRA